MKLKVVNRIKSVFGEFLHEKMVNPNKDQAPKSISIFL
jgi:hypothetical protein